MYADSVISRLFEAGLTFIGAEICGLKNIESVKSLRNRDI